MNAGGGRALGVDLGAARIGIALSDPTRTIAQPLETLRAVGPRRDVEAIVALAARHEAAVVVIGLPLRMSGEEGSAAAAARDFAERLRRRLPAVRVELQDERWTTVEAERALGAGGVRGARRRAAVDSVAASLMLQGWLDARAGDRPCAPDS